MSRVTVDPNGQFNINGITERVEVLDDSGRRLGIFTPESDRSRYEGVRIPSFTAEELDRFEREPGGRGLAEILADLEGKS